MAGDEVVEPTDHIDPRIFAYALGSLYFLSYIFSGVLPITGALLVTIVSGIMDGKIERKDDEKKQQRPVSIQLNELDILGFKVWEDRILSFKPYTTDLHDAIPDVVSRVYMGASGLASETANKVYSAVNNDEKEKAE